jgi:hypothetical protein
MAPDPSRPPDPHPYANDTKRTTPRRFLVIAAPLAALALLILIVAVKFIGHAP